VTPSNTPTPSNTATITPTFTATFTNTPSPTPTLDPECNRAGFLADVTVPDGTIITATEKFTKTWRFENIGTCTWTTDYKLVFIGGDKMNAPDSIPMPKNVAPGESVELSIDLTAPAIEGRYKGVWILEDENGNRFGMGSSSNGEIWVQITSVIAPTSVPTETPAPLPTQTSAPTVMPLFEAAAVNDLAAQNCSALWSNNNGTLTCPESASDAGAAASLTSSAAVEDGTTPGYPSIAVIPGTANGFVVGIYADYVVQPGDHFRALASCEANATTCSVLFRVRYQEGANEIVDLWAVAEFYDGQYTAVNIDLSALAGKTIKLILDVKSLNSGPADRALWVAPGIYREELPTPTPTLTPEATATALDTPVPTLTAIPSATATPAPLPTPQPSIWQSIQEFFRSLFGG
jgi:hypothetical protein